MPLAIGFSYLESPINFKFNGETEISRKRTQSPTDKSIGSYPVGLVLIKALVPRPDVNPAKPANAITRSNATDGRGSELVCMY